MPEQNHFTTASRDVRQAEAGISYLRSRAKTPSYPTMLCETLASELGVTSVTVTQWGQPDH
jgi:hypothetical protein